MTATHRFTNHSDYILLREQDGVHGTIKPIPEDEFDREDIGQGIFYFTPSDGSEPFHAFEDELTPCRSLLGWAQRKGNTMDFQASQEITNIVADMEPEDALSVLLAIIRGLDGVVVSVFTRQDVIGFLDKYNADAELTDDELSQIADFVTNSREWRSLEDATESDWETIKCAAWDAAGVLGIDLNRND